MTILEAREVLNQFNRSRVQISLFEDEEGLVVKVDKNDKYIRLMLTEGILSHMDKTKLEAFLDGYINKFDK